MSADDVPEIRDALRDLRAHDETHAPPFQAVLGRTRSHTLVSRRSIILWTAAAACLALAGALAARMSFAPRTAAPTHALTIHNWTSPTAGLLQTPVRELLQPRPILSSVLDGIATRRGGVK